MQTDPTQAAYAALWDSEQPMRLMVAIVVGCPFVVAVGSPLARAELAYQGPNPEDWMLIEAGVDLSTLDDGLWVVEGMVAYGSPVGMDPDVSADSWAMTFRRPTATEAARLAQGADPWSEVELDPSPGALEVRLWGSQEWADHGDADTADGSTSDDCDGLPDDVAEWGPVPRVSCYTLGTAPEEVRIEERRQPDGSTAWRVGTLYGCWTRERVGFVVEPLPSSRDAEWLQNARWTWVEAMVEAEKALDHLRASRRRREVAGYLHRLGCDAIVQFADTPKTDPDAHGISAANA